MFNWTKILKSVNMFNDKDFVQKAKLLYEICFGVLKLNTISGINKTFTWLAWI